MRVNTEKNILFYCGLFLLTMSTKSFATSGTINKKISLRENQPTGKLISELSSYVDAKSILRPGKNFQLITQKLLTRRNLYFPTENKYQWFSLDERTGKLLLHNKVDREEICGNLRKCIIRVQIFVKPCSRMINLDVEIVDVNEHAPAFPVPFIFINVSEGSPVDDVMSLDQYLASDKDSGNNSSIVYSLNRNSHFRLVQYRDGTGSQHVQVELRKKLDYEKKTFYRLTLHASDSGSPSFSSHVPLQIKVTDENDNKPTFDQQEYSVSLQENSPPGQVIITVQAHDSDSGESGSVRYSISGANRHLTSSFFQINEENGEVTLKKSLDREVEDELIVFLEARDLGKKPKVGRARLYVYIHDVNDNAPIISVSFIERWKDNTVYINETSTGYFAYVNARDNDVDVNGEVTMKINSFSMDEEDQDESNTFFLTDDGFLVVNKRLDQEKINRYKIIINASDGGIKERRSSTKEINVVVLDENDNSPQFSHESYNLTVLELTEVGSEVAVIQAIDLDSKNPSALQINQAGEIVPSTNGKITYTIKGGEGFFSVGGENGAIRLEKTLDREEREKWKLIVTATDRGYPSQLSTSCELSITVDDVNDNAPVFTNPIRDGATLYATILRDDIIANVQAVDYDAGKNAALRYTLTSESRSRQSSHGNTSLFILDANSGELHLNRSRKNLSDSLGHHVLVVEARDKGTPPRKSLRTLNVIVTDDVILPSVIPYGQKNGEMEFPVTTVIIIGSSAGFLILVTLLIIAIICRRRLSEKKPQSYDESIATKPYDSDPRFSANMRLKAFELSEPQGNGVEKGNQTWVHSSESKKFDSLARDSASTQMTNTSRNDVMMTHQFETFPRNATESCVTSQTGKRLIVENASLLSVPPPSVIQHDLDSGRGDSDPDVGSGDLLYDPAFIRESYSSVQSPAASTNQHNSLAPNCDQHCLEFGHSDACWMPALQDFQFRISPSPTSEDNQPSLSPYHEVLTPRSDCGSLSTNLEPIPESLPIDDFYPQVHPCSNPITTNFKNIIPHVFVTPAGVELVDAGYLAAEYKRIGSSADSTTTGYVTESEVV